MVKRTVTLGADPELILYKKHEWDMARVEVAYPVCGIFKGKKGEPVQLDFDTGGWLEDGTMLELNPRPSSSAIVLSERTSRLWESAKKHAATYNLVPLASRDTAVYQEADLKPHADAYRFGCALDLDAYSQGSERESPMAAAMKEVGDAVRFAGGHLHLGVTPWPESLPKFVAVRLMDLLLGLPLQTGYGAGMRLKYYGLPGLYRETPYGLEYRTPNNSWLTECRSGSPTLGRLKMLGMMFADFEEFQDDIIRIYNSINWDQFSAAFKTGNPDHVLDCLDMLFEGPRESIRIGERLYSLSSISATYRVGADRDERVIPDFRDPAMLNPVPAMRDEEVPVPMGIADRLRGEPVVNAANFIWQAHEANERVEWAEARGEGLEIEPANDLNLEDEFLLNDEEEGPEEDVA